MQQVALCFVWDSWEELVCSRWLCVVCVGQLGGMNVQQVALCCVCWTVGGVNVQQVALYCECGTVAGVSVQQVALCCVWGSWGE